MRAVLQTGGRNDCESVVRARFPEVADALDWLAQALPARSEQSGDGANLTGPRLTGTGRVSSQASRARSTRSASPRECRIAGRVSSRGG